MSKPQIDLQQVRHVAELARLALCDEEAQTMRAQLNSILEYMARLDELDVSEVEPTYHTVAMHAALRPDEVRPSLDRDEALSQAPKQEEGGFAVPRVMEGEG